MKKILLFAGVLLAVAANSAEKPEISWSIMHPTGIDVKYMKRVAEKSTEYGGVDSFEVCGDCHSAYGGINGLSMLEPYPKSRSKVDPAAVKKARRELNAIVDIAHSVGKPLYGVYAVTQLGGILEIQVFCRFFHILFKLF